MTPLSRFARLNKHLKNALWGVGDRFMHLRHY